MKTAARIWRPVGSFGGEFDEFPAAWACERGLGRFGDLDERLLFGEWRVGDEFGGDGAEGLGYFGEPVERDVSVEEVVEVLPGHSELLGEFLLGESLGLEDEDHVFLDCYSGHVGVVFPQR